MFAQKSTTDKIFTFENVKGMRSMTLDRVKSVKNSLFRKRVMSG
jgi:site-specific DNA-cytosine methylase